MALCLLPHLSGLGGPASFQSRLIAGLTARGIPISFDPSDPAVTSILVVGGTSDLLSLHLANRRGVHIVQRLNGMNWIHRVKNTGLRHYLRSEINNLLLAYIRHRLAAEIVYQSGFSQYWWEHANGKLTRPTQVIYNAVDLDAITPTGPGSPPDNLIRIQMVEGHLGGGNEIGFQNGIALAETLIRDHNLPIELCIAGDAPADLRRETCRRLGQAVNWLGPIPRERIPEINRSAHLFFSADLNAACPNSVIEALACGLPVVAFDTGALNELVPQTAGRVVPYGGDHWKLEPADVSSLARAAKDLLADLPRYRTGARRQAEAAFGLDRMVEAYLAVFR